MAPAADPELDGMMRRPSRGALPLPGGMRRHGQPLVAALVTSEDSGLI
jgi:hypothetical protein